MIPTPPERNPSLASSWEAAGLWQREPFSHYFDETCKRLGARDALVDGDVRLSFEEVRRRSQALARALAAIGVGRGTMVAVQLPNWWETVVVYHALIRLGAILNPVLPACRERELGFILEEGRAEVLFVPGIYRGFDHRALAERLRAQATALREVIVVRDAPGEMELGFGPLVEGRTDVAGIPGARPGDAPDVGTGRGDSRVGARSAPEGADVLLLMYTSGTTADPKGVLHSHRGLLYEVGSLRGVHALGEDDVILMPSPLTHVSGLIHAALLPFVLGTRAVLMDRWDAGHALRLLGREGVTYMVGAPVFLSDLAFHPGLDPAHVRRFRLFSCGGAGVSPDLVRESRARLGCVAKRVYGSTEFPTLTTTGPDDPPERGLTSDGRAIGAAEVRLVDDAGTTLPPGREGEILARGPECFLGYRNAALDGEAFTSDGWFRTGDLGVIDDEGYLTVTGRKKDIVIRKGEKISAAEVEAAVARHPAVADVAVVALPDAATGERACACVILRPGTSLALDELTAGLRQAGLASHKLPERLEIVVDLPRTASGKVKKHVLRERILGRG